MSTKFIHLALLTSVVTGNLSSKSFNDAIAALRGSGRVSFPSLTAESTIAGGSLIETGEPHKPLTVAEFSEWLHNLYYTEEQKRESAIKSLFDSDRP